MRRSADRIMTHDRAAPESSLLPSARAPFLAALALGALALLLLPFEDVLLLGCNQTLRSGSLIWDFLEAWTPLALLGTAIPLGAWLLFRARTRSFRTRGLLLLAVPLLAITAAETLKASIARPRPMSDGLGLVARGLTTPEPLVDTRSFPSGHVVTTTAVLACFVILLSARPRARWLLLGIPLLMLDRLALARHFPSDVLAGAALACLVTALALRALKRGIDPVAPRWKPLLALILVLAAGFAVAKPVTVVDVSGEEIEGITSSARIERLLLEPVLGPALALARSTTPRALAESALPLFAAALLALLFLPAAGWRRRILRAAALLVWAGLVTGVVLFGLAPGDRWSSVKPGLFLDLHVHGGDPADGRADADELVAASAARGIDVVALTHHDAVASGPNETQSALLLEGFEWSADVTSSAGVVPHFLCFGERGALEAGALSAREFALRARLSAEDLLGEIRALKARGLVLVVAHDIATRSAWRPGGRLERLPTLTEYVAAGVDGFELRHRGLPGSRQDAVSLETLAALCVEHRLLALGGSDSHGPVRGSPCATFMPGEFSADPIERRREVLQRLAEHGPHAALLVAAPGLELRKGVRLPLKIGWDYLRSMPGAARVSWLGWAALLTLLFTRKRGRSALGVEDPAKDAP